MNIGLRDPFFNPLWRRIATVAACLGWAGFELAIGNPGWAGFFAAIGLCSGWVFLFRWQHQPPRNATPARKEDE